MVASYSILLTNNKNATGAQQAAEKLDILSANAKSVIPEVAKRLSGIQYFNGYRISTSSRPV